MTYVFDHYSLLYMLEQFPRNIAIELWEIFAEGCKNGIIISHREAQKMLEQEAIEQESLEWSKSHSSFFKPTTTAEAETLGNMMDQKEFDFLVTPNLIQRRLPEAIPFLLCMAKKRDCFFVYRKNTNMDFIAKTLKICKRYGIKYMEVEECLMALKASIRCE